jgi:hypothetical protein
MSRRTKALGALVVVALAIGALAGTASAKVAEFASEKYPAALTGNQVGVHEFIGVAGPLRCMTAKVTGNLAAQSKTVVFAPSYENCTFVGKPAAVAINGCTYTFEAGLLLNPKEAMGAMKILCPTEKEIVVTAGECVMKIPPTAGEGPGFIDFINVEEKEIEAKLDVAPLNYSLNATCGPKEGAYEGGKLVGPYRIKGNAGPIGVL